MAGTFTRAGGGILRRATAMGLGGLAIALLVGVFSFALTTPSAGQSQESSARYLTVPSRVIDLSTLTSGAAQLTQRAGALIGPEGGTGDAGDAGGTTVVRSSVNQHALEMSLLGITQEPRPLQTWRSVASGSATGDAATGGGSAGEAASAAVEAASLTAAPVSDPALGPGDRVMATVSFYYCEQGTEALPRGDGGNFCGLMRDGTQVYPGAAACAYAYLGQSFRIVGDPTGRTYRCADTGSAVHGLHRDIWFMSSDEGWAWQRSIGQVAEIEILP